MGYFNFFRFWQGAISFVLIGSLVISPEIVYAQSAFISTLPVPGAMVGQSVAFVPVLVKGLVVHPDKPLNFDFIVDSGNDSADQAVVKEQSERIAKYFLAAVTVPEDQLWVNLSPYEKNRIIENELGQTVLGRDMLAQDYVLKQVTASLVYPEKGLGKEFWAKIYKEAEERFGTTDIPVDTFNKVWIMPEKAVVFEKGNAVYVADAKLKVMLDSDHTAMTKNSSEGVSDDKAALTKSVMREIVIPAIEKEVNEGKNFAVIRQVYQAAILAKWYRELIQNTLLSNMYVGKNRVAGVTSDEKVIKEEIYQRYIAAYKKGVFSLIKEEVDPTTGGVVPRKYFSGGIEDFAMKNVPLTRTVDPLAVRGSIGQTFDVQFSLNSPGGKATNNSAMVTLDSLRSSGQKVIEFFGKGAIEKEAAGNPGAILLLGNHEIRTALNFIEYYKKISETGKKPPILISGGVGAGTVFLRQRITEYYEVKGWGVPDGFPEMSEAEILQDLLIKSGISSDVIVTPVESEADNTFRNFFNTLPELKDLIGAGKLNSEDSLIVFQTPTQVYRTQVTGEDVIKKAGLFLKVRTVTPYDLDLSKLTDQELVITLFRIVGLRKLGIKGEISLIEKHYKDVADGIDEGTKVAFAALEEDFNRLMEMSPELVGILTGDSAEKSSERSLWDVYKDELRSKQAEEKNAGDMDRVVISMTPEQGARYRQEIEKLLANEPVVTSAVLLKAAKAVLKEHPEWASHVGGSIALQPGSMNPYTNGHLAVSLAGILSADLRGAIVATGGAISEKPYALSAELRRWMTRKAVEDIDPLVKVSSIRNDSFETFKDGSLSKWGKDLDEQVRTMDLAGFIWLFAANPDVKWVYLAGSDKVVDYPKKNEIDFIKNVLHDEFHATILYFLRKNETSESLYKAIKGTWAQTLWDEGFFQASTKETAKDIEANELKLSISRGDETRTAWLSNALQGVLRQNPLIGRMYSLEMSIKEIENKLMKAIADGQREQASILYGEWVGQVQELLAMPAISIDGHDVVPVQSFLLKRKVKEVRARVDSGLTDLQLGWLIERVKAIHGIVLGADGWLNVKAALTGAGNLSGLTNEERQALEVVQHEQLLFDNGIRDSRIAGIDVTIDREAAKKMKQARQKLLNPDRYAALKKNSEAYWAGIPSYYGEVLEFDQGQPTTDVKVSVGILSLFENGLDPVLKRLDELAGSVNKTETEIVISLLPSTADQNGQGIYSSEKLTQLKEKIAATGLRAKLVFSKSGLKATNHNIVASLSRGEFLVFVDDDGKLTAGVVPSLIDALRKNSDLGILGAATYLTRNGKKILAEPVAAAKFFPASEKPTGSGPVFELAVSNRIDSKVVALRREIMEINPDVSFAGDSLDWNNFLRQVHLFGFMGGYVLGNDAYVVDEYESNVVSTALVKPGRLSSFLINEGVAYYLSQPVYGEYEHHRAAQQIREISSGKMTDREAEALWVSFAKAQIDFLNGTAQEIAVDVKSLPAEVRHELEEAIGFLSANGAAVRDYKKGYALKNLSKANPFFGMIKYSYNPPAYRFLDFDLLEKHVRAWEDELNGLLANIGKLQQGGDDLLTEAARAVRSKRCVQAFDVEKQIKAVYKMLGSGRSPAIDALRLRLLRLQWTAKRISKESFLFSVSKTAPLVVVPFVQLNRFGEVARSHHIALHDGLYLPDGLAISEQQNPKAHRQPNHSHHGQEMTVAISGDINVVRIGADKQDTVMPVPAGSMIKVAPDTLHRIDNPNKEAESADFTIKAPLVQLQKDFEYHEDPFSDGIRVIEPVVEQKDENATVLRHYYPGMAHLLDLDPETKQMFFDQKSTPLDRGDAYVKVKLVYLKPGKDIDIHEMSAVYEGLQIVRVFPWPEKIWPGWDLDTSREQLTGRVEVFDRDHQSLSAADFKAGDLFVLRGKNGAIDGSFNVRNTSTEHTLIFAIAEKMTDEERLLPDFLRTLTIKEKLRNLDTLPLSVLQKNPNGAVAALDGIYRDLSAQPAALRGQKFSVQLSEAGKLYEKMTVAGIVPGEASKAGYQFGKYRAVFNKFEQETLATVLKDGNGKTIAGIYEWVQELSTLTEADYKQKLQDANDPRGISELGYKALWLIWNGFSQNVVQDFKGQLEKADLKQLAQFVTDLMIVPNDLGTDPQTGLPNKWFYGSSKQSKDMIQESFPQEDGLKERLKELWFPKAEKITLKKLTGGPAGTGSWKVVVEEGGIEKSYALKQALTNLLEAIYVASYQQFLYQHGLPVPNLVSFQNSRELTADELKVLDGRERSAEEKEFAKKHIVRIGPLYFYLEEFHSGNNIGSFDDIKGNESLSAEAWKNTGKLMASIHNAFFENNVSLLGRKVAQPNIAIANAREDFNRLEELLEFFAQKGFPVSFVDAKYKEYKKSILSVLGQYETWAKSGQYEGSDAVPVHQDIQPNNILWNKENGSVDTLLDFERVRPQSRYEEFKNSLLFARSFDAGRMKLVLEGYQSAVNAGHKLTKADMHSLVQIIRGALMWGIAGVFIGGRGSVNSGKDKNFMPTVSQMDQFLQAFPIGNDVDGKNGWWKEFVDQAGVDRAMTSNAGPVLTREDLEVLRKGESIDLMSAEEQAKEKESPESLHTKYPWHGEVSIQRILKQVQDMESELGRANPNWVGPTEKALRDFLVVKENEEKPEKFKGEEVHVLNGIGPDAKVVGRIDRGVAEKFGYIHETANVVMTDPENLFVLQLRNKPNYDNHFSPYGGHLEVGEAHPESALNEAKQESGLNSFKSNMNFLDQQGYDIANDKNRERRSWYAQELDKGEWGDMRVKKAEDEREVGADRTKDDYDTYKWKLATLWPKGRGEVTLVTAISWEDMQNAKSRMNPESKLPDQSNYYLTIREKFKGGAYSFLPGEFERAGLDSQQLRFALEKAGVRGDDKEKIAVKWLNKLLAEGVNGDPLPYERVQETVTLKEAREAYEKELQAPSTPISLVVPKRIRLNREILGAIYSGLCPRRSTGDEVVIDAFFTPDSLDLLLKDQKLRKKIDLFHKLQALLPLSREGKEGVEGISIIETSIKYNGQSRDELIAKCLGQLQEFDSQGAVFEVKIVSEEKRTPGKPFWSAQYETTLEPVSFETIINDAYLVPFKKDGAKDGAKDGQDDNAMNGGIDIQNVDILHRDGSTRIKFNDQAVRAILENGFNGFTPVIINITPVQSPLMILGVNQTEGAKAHT
jgi:ADP-ribose pyrophosphatase YjhB (NUDIX family)